MYRLSELRLEKGLNMSETAKQLGMPYTTYVSYEKGEREPNSDILIKIAEYYGTTIDYILGITDRKTNYNFVSPNITEDFVQIPVIGEIAAGFEHLAYEEWANETIDVPTSYLRGRQKTDFFGLTVKGDSMYPMYHDGDKVLILKCSSVDRSGDVGAVIYNGECATLKKLEFAKGEDWLRLVPINPNYTVVEIEGVDLEQCSVLGVPKLLIRDL